VTAYWALQHPGDTYVLYTRGLTTPATFTIDGVGGVFTARLFDPRSGTWKDLGAQNFAEQVDQAQITAVGGAATPSAGLRSARLNNRYTFTSPDAQDWLVVLQRRP
jgi:hypothetical protein